MVAVGHDPATKLRVYADRTHYVESERKALNDILKATWNKGTVEQRRAIHGALVDSFDIVDSPDAADIHLLTMKWQYYVDHDRVDSVRRAVDVARRAGRPIAVFSYGDFDANFPISGQDIHLFQAAGHRSRDHVRNHGIAPFFDDPLAGGAVQLRDKGRRPVVGFCGQAGSSLGRHAARYARMRLRRLRWRLGRDRWEPTELEHTWLRRRILDAFANSPQIESQFVLRTHYRAGVHGADRSDPAQQSRREFLDNLRDTDYTVCVRGGGNFSVRFYEALATGRMPVFIDTDCILPYAEKVDWRHYAAWVDEGEAMRAPEVLSRFHDRLSPSEFRERQLECRRLWETRLSPNGYYAHFHEHFHELA